MRLAIPIVIAILLFIFNSSAQQRIGIPSNEALKEEYLNYAEVYVDDDFNSSTPGWQKYRFDKIQDGVDSVAPSGTVFVSNGLYFEHVKIDKTINLLGENAEDTILFAYAQGIGIEINADKVKIANISIQNSGRDYPAVLINTNNNIITKSIITNSSTPSILLETASNNIITENTIELASIAAIEMNMSHYNICLNNFIDHCSKAFYLKHSSNNLIESNTSVTTYSGIDIVYESNTNIISNNTITGIYSVYYGIKIGNDPDNNTISYNTIRDFNDSGILFSGNDPLIPNHIYNNIIENSEIGIEAIYQSKSLDVHDNYICNNSDSGILMIDTNGGVIYNNIISNNNYGIYIWAGENIEIFNNNIQSNKEVGILFDNAVNLNVYNNTVMLNQIGFKLYFDCLSNKYYHNNFIDNLVNASDEGVNCWDNDYPDGGNYWDDYLGWDSDGDGIGDTPYLIPPNGENKDRYPLMDPSEK